MVIGEQSDWLTDVNGEQVDYRSGGYYGFMMGCENCPGSPRAFYNWCATQAGAESGGDNRTFNVTSVRYPINYKKGSLRIPVIPSTSASALTSATTTQFNPPILAGHRSCSPTVRSSGYLKVFR